MALEQEVKLAYPNVEAARQAINLAGGRLVVSRRLLDDRFYDTHDFSLKQAGQGLRIRQDGSHAILTWKGPVQPGAVKTREEIESDCNDAVTLAAVLGALGFVPRFRSQKYREEYHLADALVTIDEAPMGVFVEIEATLDAIADATTRLGRSPADYNLSSYISLWRRWCEAHHVPFGDMVFEPAAKSL